MNVLEETKPCFNAVLPFNFVSFIAAVSFVLLPSAASSQNLSSSIVNKNQISINRPFLSSSLPESDFGAYDQRQIEPLGDIGRQQQRIGEHLQALAFFKQALHVVRINNGLYHEAQLPILSDIIESETALKNWEAVDDRYSYMEHLYRRLYSLDDPRLEQGLREVSSWHVNALNVNIDGKRVQHLRQANKVFKLRLLIAERTLAFGDPKFDFLIQNIEICERQLYLASDLSKEINERRPRGRVYNYDRRSALVADRD
ncbi:MAG: hypothetical protein COA96_07565 [SAR86 cluster bacterium]|uniref:Uncharacterized protein n=1 Tax=SAR86 cluster bacterium TaxID=2030880 RepID=A0A2A5B1C5_9GAMM|nr:MAG: hypothetical protein COA96_07565 [SAR86 cluster bacterium]